MATVLFEFESELATQPTAAEGPKSLDGTSYLHRFAPNTRANDGAGAWLYDIRLADGTPLDVGRKLVISDDLWLNVKDDDENLPQGRLVVRRTDGLDSDPGLLGIGVSFVVEYVEVGG